MKETQPEPGERSAKDQRAEIVGKVTRSDLNLLDLHLVRAALLLYRYTHAQSMNEAGQKQIQRLLADIHWLITMG